MAKPPAIPGTASEARQGVRRTAIRVRIINEILQLIRSKKTPVGERLPSEPTLAKSLEVSRPSLREALSVLETVGVLEIRRGSGVYVKDPTAAGLDGTYAPGRRAVSSEEAEQLATVLNKIRDVVEPLAAALAARNASKQDLAGIRFHLGHLVEAARRSDLMAAAHADVAFHAAIAAASGSRILVNVLRTMEEPLRIARESRLGAFWDEDFVISTHARIFEAIERRDPALARKAMMSHLEEVSRISKLPRRSARKAAVRRPRRGQ